MLRIATSIGAVTLLLLTGCTSPPQVYSSSDTNATGATGSVKPLADLLGAERTPVRLVFIHGVGDHCPGYALNAKKGWLNHDAMQKIGLRAVGEGASPQRIAASTFMPKVKPAEKAYVAYGTQHYTLTLPGGKETDVEAIEITWSGLTQWIKSNQLGYDSPSTTRRGDDLTKEGCAEPIDSHVPATKNPPNRLLLDRIIKEDVFDRSLADAIIYSGSYSPVIVRGVAEALCHAVTQQPSHAPCIWPKETSSDKPWKYLFVTHSLGSRIIYDTTLNLLGYDTSGKANPFGEQEQDAANEFVTSMVANTPAFYMMANQLSLIGLANVPPDAQSNTGAHPLTIRMVVNSLLTSEAEISTKAVALRPLKQLCQSPMAAFGAVRERIVRQRLMRNLSVTDSSPRLQLIAFNDTNDLLTWHIPPWYANEEATQADCRPPVDLVNVFVQNTVPLLIIESPGPAHSNYFKNEDVWKVLACGVNNGVLNRCNP